MKSIRTERELVNYLRSLREQAEEAPAPSPSPAPATTSSSIPGPSVVGADQKQPITVDDIVEKLNIVRSGRSTKDANVKSELEQYIAQFDEDEKTALIAFLEGLGQILTSGVDSSEAADPRDPYALQIQKSAGATAANAVKAPTPAAAPTPTPTPGPVPIKVGGV